MTTVQSYINLFLKLFALAMGAAAAVLGILGTADIGAITTLLGMGLFAIALVALQPDRPS